MNDVIQYFLIVGGIGVAVLGLPRYSVGIGGRSMTEQWVPEAIAQQEEYLKRRASCSPDRWPNGFNEHRWDRFHKLDDQFYEACFICRVTKTDADYQIKVGSA